MMHKIAFGFALLAVLLAFCELGLGPQAAKATTMLDDTQPASALPQSESATGIYYVAPNGNDANPGTISQPWRTIQKAANTLTAGEMVYIRGGTYHERVLPQRSGSEGQLITYAAYPGETVTIDGQGGSLPSWGGLFHVSGKSYIKISKLRVINVGPNLNNAGILVERSSHILIENNYTYNTASSGIGVWHSNNVVVAGNEVVLANNDGYQENITIASSYAFEVRDNHVHHGGPGTNGGEGIDAKHSFNGKVYRNHVHHLQRVGIYIDVWDQHTHQPMPGATRSPALRGICPM